MAADLAQAGGQRARPSTDEATDTIWATNSPDLYLLLTAERGRTPGRYLHWITNTGHRPSSHLTTAAGHHLLILPAARHRARQGTEPGDRRAHRTGEIVNGMSAESAGLNRVNGAAFAAYLRRNRPSAMIMLVSV